MKNKYDIITISHFFYPRVGGLENMAFGIAKSLQKAGLNVFAIHAGETDFKYYLEGFAGESIKTINLFNNSYPITGLRFIYKIIKLLRSNPDATVLIHDRHVLSSVVASFICFVLNKPYILISHTTNSNYFKNKLFNKIGEILESIFSQFVVGKADKIIAVSKTNAKYLENNFKFDLEKLEIITNGFDVKKILTLDISKKEKLIVFNTKWISVKNPDITALAFRKLAKKYPKWRFLFTGRGESIVQTFDNHPKNFEVIERFLSQEELFDLLSKSSIYVNSSHNEGLSLGIVEATGLGNIPVLSDAPGNIEVATKLLTKRFVFERNNYSSLITSIEKAIRACENKKIRQTRIHIANRSRKYFANTKTFRKYRSFLSRYRLIKSFKGAKSSKLSYSYT